MKEHRTFNFILPPSTTLNRYALARVSGTGLAPKLAILARINHAERVATSRENCPPPRVRPKTAAKREEFET